MCTVINISSTLFILLFVSLHLILLSDGLPLWRQERGTEEDLIAGKDFLSILMDVPASIGKFHRPRTTSTTNQPPTVTLATSILLENHSGTSVPNVIRESRSTHYIPIQEPASNLTPYPTQPINRDLSTLKPKKSSDYNSDSRKVVRISISSSSVEETRKIFSPTTSSTTERIMAITTPSDDENVFFAVQDQESLVAESNRNEFSVEEPEPLTRNADSSLITELPANVQSIPLIKKFSDFEKTSGLLKELSQEKLKDKLPPYHHTVIYHDNPAEQVAARSVSYSSVIQTVPGDAQMRRWKPNKLQETEPTQNSMHDYNSGDYDDSLEENVETSTISHVEPTERNWGVQQKPLPVIYGQPEVNYEVDEAVSVQTNGRTHGIQPSQSTEEQKPTAKSKNGYVIEGRNGRLYRVEERTSDGFIVGEFGIISRDDGLLRGVRYTAEETINPKLIYETFKKFLSL